ncbi:MAG: FprA family A-type flavoprotein [Deltaproteobacteria bacterium]|nr:FprA family A-type flavoprotein [Deltaproteobacteria bacterium]
MTQNDVLFDKGNHKNILLKDFSSGMAVQANQHLIVSGREGMILDPGGHKVYNKVLIETLSLLEGASLRYVFLSHQDPDIIAAVNGWLMTTDAEAWISALWTRFVPHFGLDRLVEDRLKPIPDPGMRLRLGDTDLLLIPGHFLHSPGNFQVYDPVSKILYSGDLGASLGRAYRIVPDDKIDEHLDSMQGFHERYMAGGAAMQAWANMVRQLDIEMIAPQHGSVMQGKLQIDRFITWCENLRCGVDLIADVYKLPA